MQDPMTTTSVESGPALDGSRPTLVGIGGRAAESVCQRCGARNSMPWRSCFQCGRLNAAAAGWAAAAGFLAGLIALLIFMLLVRTLHTPSPTMSVNPNVVVLSPERVDPIPVYTVQETRVELISPNSDRFQVVDIQQTGTTTTMQVSSSN